MAIAHNFAFGWSGTAGTLAQAVVASTPNANEENFDAVLAASTTNQQRAIAFATAKLLSLFVLSDTALTLKTNSTSAPQDTIAIAANVPFVWVAGSGVPFPFAGAVSTTYWTNGTAGAANLHVRALIDQ